MVLEKAIPHIKEFTKIPFNVLYTVGVLVKRWSPYDKPNDIQLAFLSKFAIVIIALNCGYILGYLFFVFGTLETSLEKTAWLIYNTYAAKCVLKLIIFYYNRDKLRQALKILEKLYPKTNKERNNFQLDNYLMKIKKFNRYLTIFHYTVCKCFSLFPLAQSIYLYYYTENGLFPYEIPYPGYFGFNIENNLGYIITYIVQVLGIYVSSGIFLGCDLLLISCVHLINMNFANLSRAIRDFKPKGALDDLKQLREFLVYHKQILRSAELIDSVFNISNLQNYICTCTITCLVGFQLVAGTNFLDLIKYLSFLLVLTIHIFFISLFGNEMICYGLDVHYAFMHHAWYDAHIKYQKALVLPIAKAQREVHLNAFKFFIISMETFKSLTSISYQFFTLIKTRYGDQ